jgi:hypothetical protein
MMRRVFLWPKQFTYPELCVKKNVYTQQINDSSFHSINKHFACDFTSKDLVYNNSQTEMVTELSGPNGVLEKTSEMRNLIFNAFII